jgi:hypothetical protein
VHSPVILAESEAELSCQCGLLYLHTLIRIRRARNSQQSRIRVTGLLLSAADPAHNRSDAKPQCILH